MNDTWAKYGSLSDPVTALEAALSAQSGGSGSRRMGLAISGGLDSMVLLAAASEIHERGDGTGVEFCVLHVDHGLRVDSSLDAKLVEEGSKNAGFHFEAMQAEIDAGATGSLEARARNARYSLLYQAMRRLELDLLISAQHLDDQAETVLLQHMRGADLLGLGGMPKSRFLVAGKSPRVLRPFLGLRKSRLREYAVSHKVNWREDHSNRDLSHRRNLIRNLIIPMLESDAGVDWTDRLAALGERTSVANQRIVKISIAAEKKIELVRHQGKESKSISLPLSGLHILPAEVSFHILVRQLEDLGAPGGALSPALFAQIITAEEAGESFELKRDLHARTKMTGNDLWLDLELKTGGKGPIEIQSTSVRSGERVEIEGLGALEVDVFEEAAPRHAGDEQWLPAAVVQGELVLRCAEEGERMEPFGMVGTKLLSDLMQEARVPKDERWTRPLVADDAGVLWIPHVRASERCRILGTKGPFLRLRFVSLG